MSTYGLRSTGLKEEAGVLHSHATLVAPQVERSLLVIYAEDDLVAADRNGETDPDH